MLASVRLKPREKHRHNRITKGVPPKRVPLCEILAVTPTRVVPFLVEGPKLRDCPMRRLSLA